MKHSTIPVTTAYYYSFIILVTLQNLITVDIVPLQKDPDTLAEHIDLL